jgi:hypothetical protein
VNEIVISLYCLQKWTDFAKAAIHALLHYWTVLNINDKAIVALLPEAHLAEGADHVHTAAVRKGFRRGKGFHGGNTFQKFIEIFLFQQELVFIGNILKHAAAAFIEVAAFRCNSRAPVLVRQVMEIFLFSFFSYMDSVFEVSALWPQILSE